MANGSAFNQEPKEKKVCGNGALKRVLSSFEKHHISIPANSYF
jgi:hypothetical protein